MREVGADEAERNLARLLDRVEAGEEIAITREGKAVARLLPTHAPIDRERARSAAAAIRAMSEGTALGGLKLRDLVSEGRS